MPAAAGGKARQAEDSHSKHSRHRDPSSGKFASPAAKAKLSSGESAGTKGLEARRSSQTADSSKAKAQHADPLPNSPDQPLSGPSLEPGQDQRPSAPDVLDKGWDAKRRRSSLSGSGGDQTPGDAKRARSAPALLALSFRALLAWQKESGFAELACETAVPVLCSATDGSQRSFELELHELQLDGMMPVSCQTFQHLCTTAWQFVVIFQNSSLAKLLAGLKLYAPC